MTMASLKKKSPKHPQKKRTFRSKFEQSVAENLDKVGINYEYEAHRLPFFVVGNYLPDFRLPSGVFVEAKGYFKSADQRKHRLLKEQRPDLEVRFVFQNASGRVQGSKLTCAEWCQKHGFLYAESFVPKEWL